MLEYSEFQKGREITINFDRICPYSSNTIQNHMCKQKKGLSIVAFFNDTDDFSKLIKDEINNEIDKLKCNFVHTENLHCTFLGISRQHIFNENLNEYFIGLIQKTIKNFFDERENNINFQLKFDEIRPGTWHGFDKNQIPNAGDGTVVAIGKPSSNGNKDFVKLAEELVCYLKDRLGQIFSDKFERKFPTIWSTLGYFLSKDFDVTPDFIKTFNQWKKSEHIKVNEISIKNLVLVKHTFKDLSDAKHLEKY
jgi:hypothetical protein